MFFFFIPNAGFAKITYYVYIIQCNIPLNIIIIEAFHCAEECGTISGSQRAVWPCDTLITGFTGFTKAVGTK